jgi:RecJ-like exonuclease
LSYFRLHDDDADPNELLDRDNQWSEPWGDVDVPAPCDKCGGSGHTGFECLSCDEHPSESCEVCHGDVRFVDTCPTCKGSGEITDQRRRGVSVFPDAGGLLRYMARRDVDLSDARLVELEGERAEEMDFDADEGALLVRPTRIVAVHDADPRDVDRARERVAAER